MAQVLGPHALIDIALPTGVDGAEIARRSLEQGLSADQALALAAVEIGRVNEKINATYGGLVHYTSQFWKRYRKGQGARRMTPLAGELSRNDAVRGEQAGHMFPRHDYEDAIEWTKQFEKRADLELVRASVMEVADSWENRFDYDFWARALTGTENAVGGGYDVPWAIGTGTNVDFIPPDWMGNTFTSSHTHFNVHDDTSEDWDDVFEAAMEDLRHHGYLGDGIVIYTSQADVTEYSAVTGFAALEQPNIVLVGGNTASPVRYARGTVQGAPGEAIGFYNSQKGWGQAEVRTHPRIPTNYGAAFYSRGIDHPQNPLAVYVEDEGFGLRVDARVTPTRTPKVEAITFEAVHGVGTNERLAGVAFYLNAGANAWVNPSLT